LAKCFSHLVVSALRGAHVLGKPLLPRDLKALDDAGCENKRTYTQSSNNQRHLKVTLLTVLHACRWQVAVLEETDKDQVEGLLAPII
jgi:hypothetical protein